MLTDHPSLKEAIWFRKNGEYAKSFEHLLCFLNSFLSEESDDVNKTVALAYSVFATEIAKLGIHYGLANEMIEKIIQDSWRSICRLERPLRNFRLFYALLRARGSQTRIFEAFSFLDIELPPIAKAVFPIVCKLHLTAKRFDVCEAYLSWDTIVTQAVSPLICLKQTSMRRRSLIEFKRSRMIREASLYLQFLLHFGRTEQAFELLNLIKSAGGLEGDYSTLESALHDVSPEIDTASEGLEQ